MKPLLILQQFLDLPGTPLKELMGVNIWTGHLPALLADGEKYRNETPGLLVEIIGGGGTDSIRSDSPIVQFTVFGGETDIGSGQTVMTQGPVEEGYDALRERMRESIGFAVTEGKILGMRFESGPNYVPHLEYEGWPVCICRYRALLIGP